MISFSGVSVAFFSKLLIFPPLRRYSASQRRNEHEMPSQVFVAIVFTMYQQGILVILKELNSSEGAADTASTITVPDSQVSASEPSFEAVVERLFYCKFHPTSDHLSSNDMRDLNMRLCVKLFPVGMIILDIKEIEIRGAIK